VLWSLEAQQLTPADALRINGQSLYAGVSVAAKLESIVVDDEGLAQHVDCDDMGLDSTSSRQLLAYC